MDEVILTNASEQPDARGHMRSVMLDWHEPKDGFKFSYDGAPKHINWPEVKSGVLESDASDLHIYAYRGNDAIDAGAHTVTCHLDGRAKDNYTIDAGCGTVEYTILPKPLALTWEGDGFVYDGTAQAPKAKLPDGAICGSDNVSVCVHGAEANAGTYTATAVLEGERSKNYVIASGETREFCIEAARAEGTVSVLGDVTYGSTLTAVYEPNFSLDDTHEIDYEWYYLDDEQCVSCHHGDSFKPMDDATFGHKLRVKVSVTGNHTGTIYSNDTQAVGKRTIYAGEPTVTDKTYDGCATANDISISPSGIDDHDAQEGRVEVEASGAFVDGNVGQNKHVEVKLCLSGPNAKFYQLDRTTIPTTASIEPKQLDACWSDAKFTYNGAAQAPDACLGDITQIVDGDVVDLTVGGQEDVPGAYIAEAILSNENYVPANACATCAFTIAPLTVKVTGTKVAHKTYDGSTLATLARQGTLKGVLATDSDKVALKTTATFADKNVGKNKHVSLRYALEGTRSECYQLNNEAASTKASISRRTVSLVWEKGEFVYCNDAQGPSPRLAEGARCEHDELGVCATGYGTDAGPHSLEANLTGGDKSNYTIDPADRTHSYAIEKASARGIVTVSGVPTYGETLTACFEPNTRSIDTCDEAWQWFRVCADGAKEPIADATDATHVIGPKDVGCALVAQMTATDGNHTGGVLSKKTEPAARRVIDASGSVVADKTYDGATAATIVSAGTLQGVLPADIDNVLLRAVAAFDDKNAGASKRVLLSYALEGARGNCYQLVKQTTDTTAAIKPREVSLAWSCCDLVYNGQPQMPQAALLENPIRDTDELSLVVDGAQANAGTHVAEASLAGSDKDNYTIAPDSKTGSFVISPIAAEGDVTVFGTAVYGETLTASYDAGEGDTVSWQWCRIDNEGVEAKIEGAIDATHVLGPNDIDAQLVARAQVDGNHVGKLASDKTSTIARRTLSASGTTTSDKTYDGTAGAIISSVGTLEGVLAHDADRVQILATGTFASKAAEPNKAVAIRYGLSGDAATCYQLTDETASATASIHPKQVDLTWTEDTFTYDGREHLPSAAITSELADENDVSTRIQGAEVGAGENYVAKATLCGADASNYVISPSCQTLAFSIKKRLTSSVAKFEGADPEHETNATFTYGDKIVIRGKLETKTQERFSPAGDVSASATPSMPKGAVALCLDDGTRVSESQFLRNDGNYIIELDTCKRCLAVGDHVLWVVYSGTNFMAHPAKLNVRIAKRTVKPVASGTTSKVYDGTTRVLGRGSITLSLEGLLEADDVKASWSAAYDGAGAGKRRIVLSDIKLDDRWSRWYKLSSKELACEGVIKRKAVSVSGTRVADIAHGNTADASVSYAGTLVGILAQDKKDVTLDATATYIDAGTKTNKQAKVTFELKGEKAGNYQLRHSTATVRALITTAQAPTPDVPVLLTNPIVPVDFESSRALRNGITPPSDPTAPIVTHGIIEAALAAADARLRKRREEQ